MATSGELAQIVAYALEVPVETAAVHLRNIRLMLACAGSLQAKDSVETTKAFNDIQ